jgi:SAM-dependent methyltransferase
MRLARTVRARLAVLLISASITTAQSGKPPRQPDVSYVATTKEAVQMMLKLADVKKSDVVYDLGCGDGRIVIAAAKIYGARGVGRDPSVSFRQQRRREPRSGLLGEDAR